VIGVARKAVDGLLSRRVFEAMGSTVELILEGAPSDADEALAAAEQEIHRLEQMLSRFLPDSELSLLNGAGTLDVSPELVEVTLLALEARERTGSRFDPTVHDALVAAGYDRSFEDMSADGSAVSLGAPCLGHVAVNGSRIEIEPGYRLDLGGIAKGFAADRACALLAEAGPCIVNAGGDLAIHGPPSRGVWPIAVDVPGTTLTLGLGRGALATSGRDHRRWRRGGVEMHHLVDPASGRPAMTSLRRVTAYAETAAAAEVTAKALLLAGEEAAATEADALGLPCVLITTDDRLILAGGLA
jgi:FAD:protein FMN transferase